MRATGCVALAAALAVTAPVTALAADPVPGIVAPGHAPADAGPGTDRVVRGRKLLIAGGVVAGTGLLVGVLGGAVLGGMHAANPGPGLTFEGQDPAHAERTVRTARAMEGMIYGGTAVLLAGVVVLAIGGATYRKGLRERKARIAVAPGIGSLSIAGRF